MSIRTAILLLGYRRPQLILDRLRVLKNLEIKNLYIVIDKSNEQNRELFNLIFALYNKSPQLNMKLNVIFRNKNLGLTSNIITSINEVLSKHDKIIVIEDDVLINSASIIYLDRAIQNFSKFSNFGAVSGFSSITGPKYLFKNALLNYWRPTVYFPCWGWGTTKRVWELHKKRLMNLNLDYVSEIKSGAFQTFSKQTKAIWNGRFMKSRIQPNRTWDIPFQETLFLFNLVVWTPIFAKTTNVGFDDDRASNTKLEKPWWVPESIRTEVNLQKIKLVQKKYVINILLILDKLTFAADFKFQQRYISWKKNKL